MSALPVTSEHEKQADVAGLGAEQRHAQRNRVLMKAMLRIRGAASEVPLTVRDLSSTGMKAAVNVAVPAGTHVEVELRNIGWVPGEIVWVDEQGHIGVRFAIPVKPETSQNRVTGSYGPTPSAAKVSLRRV